MKSDWYSSTIGEVCSVVTDGSHFSPPSVQNGEYMVSVKDFTEYGFDFSNCRKISANDYEQLAKNGCVPQKGDVLVGKDGARYFEDIIIYKQLERPALLSSIAILRANPALITPEFLYYTLKTPNVKKDVRENYGSGSAIPRIVLKDFRRMPISFPSVHNQERITCLFQRIDDKIELNKRINENLEQQSQALYEKLCMSYSTGPLVSLADLMDYAGGSQPPASQFIYEEKVGYIRFVQIRDYDSDSHLTYIPESPRNKLCEEHDIMIARYGASLGRICSGLNGAYNVALAKVYPKEQCYREFLRCYLSSREFYEGINNKGGRSAQAGFNQSDIKSFELILPDKSALIQFEGIAASLFEQRLNLKKENMKLALLRDSLLPKLMSGELDVSNIDN